MKGLLHLGVLLAALPAIAIGQSTGSIFGVITDKSTKEPLVGANVLVMGTALGGATDKSGHYQIMNVPPGSHRIVVRRMGYKSDTLNTTIDSEGATEFNIALEPEAVSLPAVVVSGERLTDRSCVSNHAIRGESFLVREGQMQDPIKVVQTLPGIASMGDLFSPSQMYVRGGGPEENLFLLDWTRIHWPWYFGGMKSVFNSEIIDKIELQTGGFSPKYGECLSSVLNVTTREGSREHFRGNASFGLINAQAIIEGPITSKSFYLFSGRRTYLDMVMDENEEFPIPFFWDTNFKLGYEPKPGQKLHLSGLTSNEKIDYVTDDPEPGMPEKIYNDGKLNTQTLEWKNLISDKLYSVSALTRENLHYHFAIGRIQTGDLKADHLGFIEDLTWQIHPLHEVKAGLGFSYETHDFKESLPLDLTNPNMDPNDTSVQITKVEIDGVTWSGSCYIQDSWRLSRQLSLTGGLRLDHWDYSGNTDISPRLAIRYDLIPRTALRASYGLYCQNPEIEQVSKDPSLDSKKAIHYILGVTREFNDEWGGWIEFYEKDYRDLVVVDVLENYSNSGKGFSRGMEVFLEKKDGAVTGWLSYSLGLAKRREFLDNEEYYADFDQRHMASVVLDWNFLKRFTLDLQFRYASGRPYTPLVAAVWDTLAGWIPTRGETNSDRFPPFHQLNLRLLYKFPAFGLRSSAFLEVWNLYNRKNTMGCVYEYDSEYENNLKKRPYYSTPFLPSGGLRIEF